MIEDFLGGGLFNFSLAAECGCGCGCNCGAPGSPSSASYYDTTLKGGKDKAGEEQL